MTSTSMLLPLLLAASGGVLYHTAAKSIPRDLSPALVLVVAYATALAVSAAAYVAMPAAPGSAASLRLAHPAVLGLGVGAAMIELGYVFTYRTGWPVSVASVLVNGMVTALLVPVGLFLFGERLSVARVAGMLLCFAGVWLLRH